MDLESSYFKEDFAYDADLAHKCVCVVRYSKQEKKVSAFKDLLFKMMKDIVKKNIFNYLNLLSSVRGRNELPDRGELVAECYIIFDKCLDKFKITPERRFDFYFYYNKSLSRNFYRDYKKAIKNSRKVEMTDAVETVCKGFHEYSHPDTSEMLMENLKLSDLEKKICRSRLIGQKTSEFLAENEGVTNGQYSRSLKRMKELILKHKEKGTI